MSSGPESNESDGSPRPPGPNRWLTGDRIGVVLIWLVIVASLCCIALVARAVLASADCQCDGSGHDPSVVAAVAGS